MARRHAHTPPSYHHQLLTALCVVLLQELSSPSCRLLLSRPLLFIWSSGMSVLRCPKKKKEKTLQHPANSFSLSRSSFRCRASTGNTLMILYYPHQLHEPLPTVHTPHDYGKRKKTLTISQDAVSLSFLCIFFYLYAFTIHRLEGEGEEEE